MKKIELRKVDDLNLLNLLKRQYMTQTTAPLDGMWLYGFVPLATHYSFHSENSIVGYCCVNNNNNYLLQYYLCRELNAEASPLLSRILTDSYSQLNDVNGAYVSTAEPGYLSSCLDNFSTFHVNALMYQLGEKPVKQLMNPDWQLAVVTKDELAKVIDFDHRTIGAPKEWLDSYLGNLIEKQELFSCTQSGILVGTGECRSFDGFQDEYVDLGVIVGQECRGKGLATWILQQLVKIAEAMSLTPICSTERDNIGAQKAIRRAGLITEHRILQFQK